MSDRPLVAPSGTQGPDVEEVREHHPVLGALRRLRAAIVLVPLVVGLLVVAGVGASKLWADLPERPVPVADVTCWDGRVLPEPECTQPQGVAGLRWVFPSFRPAVSDCRRVRHGARETGRPLEFACRTSFDQRPVTITYSARTSLQGGLAFLERTYGAPPTEEADGERLVFSAPRAVRGRFRATIAYAHHPFTVTVEAPARDVRDGALAELVDLRPDAEVRTRP